MNFTSIIHANFGNSGSVRKIFLCANIIASQFFFLILISYVGNNGHILGEIGYSICQFLITNFFGITAFGFPLGWFYLSYSLLKQQRNISEIIRHLVWFLGGLFWFNVLLLNTNVINTSWAGLLPKFFHALVSLGFSENSRLHPLTIAFEMMMFLVFALLLTTSFFRLSYREVFLLGKNSFYRIVGVLKLRKNKKEGAPVEKGLKSRWKSRWDHFWKDMFGFIDQVDDSQIQEYLGTVPTLPRGFALMRLNRFLGPNSTSGQEENVKDIPSYPKAVPVHYDKEVAPTLERSDSLPNHEEEVIPLTKWENRTTSPAEEKDSKENSPLGEGADVIDLSLVKFFNGINGLEDPVATKKEGEDLSTEIPVSEEELACGNEEGVLFDDKKEIVPLVINPVYESIASKQRQECLAEVEKLVFSQNPTRSKTLDLEIKKTSEKLENTIKEFGINTQVVNVSQGPVITQYELTLEPGVHINKIVNLSDNIALSLAAESVRIVAPIPGKAVIGIEIPNKTREMVTLRDIVDKQIFHESTARLPVVLGASISGKPIITDLASTPHLLVAGATGSGKSVCVNSIICSLLLRRTPAQVRFLMIDPKMVELNIYNGIPHLLSPVITDPQKAAVTLKWAISEMEARYRLLERFGIRNISSYNQMVEKDKNFEYGTLPYIVIIIDEFADLMMVARKEIEDSVSRLAAMSRAIGIHLLLATQRPSVDVITGVIKANFPSRIAFQVSSKIDSRTIIDTMGAEKLLGKGDMLYQNAATGNPYRIQGTFLSDGEVREIVSDLKSKSETHYVLDLKEEPSPNSESNMELEDKVFQAAVELAKGEGKISTSLIQRRLRIGYNRAARIVELMEEQGIVGASDGVRPREVLVSNF